MKRSNQGYAYLSSTVGGSLSVLSFEDTYKGDRVVLKNRGGGPRGKVTGFSEASRLTFLRRLASVDYTAFEGRIFYITLTYADESPDVHVCKEHLEAFRKRLQRRFGNFATFWRIGIQKRGAWHFHVLLFVPPSFGSLKELRHFVSSSWYKVCGDVGEGHLLAGTSVEEIRTWRKATSYVEKYMAKVEDIRHENVLRLMKFLGYRQDE